MSFLNFELNLKSNIDILYILLYNNNKDYPGMVCFMKGDNKMQKEEIKEDIRKRLNRIEGQVRGIQKMIDSDERCNDILIQIAAIRSAINKVAGLILENYTQECIRSTINNNDDEKLNEMIDTIIKFTKYYEVKE